MGNQSPPLLTIENGNWGATSLRTIRGVLTSAADVLLAAFGRDPDAAIHVAPWRRDPQVFYDQRPYQMRLSGRDTYWCHYVSQFAHELCHVLTNFDRHRDHKHRWFNEALCEVASLFVLHRLATTWADDPPEGVTEASAFAPNFATYAVRVADRYPCPGDLPQWLADHLPELEADPYVRERNGVVAVNLLQRFLDDASLWRDCRRLNCWDPSANRTFREDLAAWARHLHLDGFEPRGPLLIAELFELPCAHPGSPRTHAAAASTPEVLDLPARCCQPD